MNSSWFSLLLLALFGFSSANGNPAVVSRLVQEHAEQKTEQEISPKRLSLEINIANHKSDREEPVSGYKDQEGGHEPAVPEAEGDADRKPVDGAGYSSDSQQVAPQRCFDATLTSVSAQGGTQLHIALSYSELETKLGVSVGVSGSYGMFSADATASYLRSVQDDDYSLSLNYYSFTTSELAVQLAGYGEAALTESGRKFYNGGKNPLFGLVCGDNYISSYQLGAFLTMGLKIKFSTSNEKTQFEVTFRASFANIISVTAKVERAVSHMNMTGSITIQAFQRGGEPSQLARILTKDSGDNYYALSCSLTAMDECKKAVSGLLDYATNDFLKQFSTETNTGLANLGIASSRITPVRYVGLEVTSLVTSEVHELRLELADRLKESEYYMAKCNPFLVGKYPVPLEMAFLDKVNSIFSKAKDNVVILMRRHGGAADCFALPDDCKNISARIYSELNNITTNDLKFLDLVKYSYTSDGSMLYNNGSEQSWTALTGSDDVRIRVLMLSADDTIYTYTTRTYNGGTLVKSCFFNGTLTKDGKTYNGTYTDFKIALDDYTEQRVLSPLFFQAYSNN